MKVERPGTINRRRDLILRHITLTKQYISEGMSAKEADQKAFLVVTGKKSA